MRAAELLQARWELLCLRSSSSCSWVVPQVVLGQLVAAGALRKPSIALQQATLGACRLRGAWLLPADPC